MEGVDIPCYLVGFDRIRGIIMCPVADFKIPDMNVKSSLPRKDDSDVTVILLNFIQDICGLVVSKLQSGRVDVVCSISVPGSP